MENRLPLPALLSHALVAFTIEFDNEAEHRMPHSTTQYGLSASSLPAPWLVSMVMYLNCMKFVGGDGITVGELGRLARTSTNLNGMLRWRYITIGEDRSDLRPRRHRPEDRIRATAGGRKAQEIWQPLFGEIELRWRQRFGEKAIAELRMLLEKIVARLDPNLPDCLPILGYGLVGRGPEEKSGSAKKQRSEPASGPVSPSPEQLRDLPLPSMFSRVLFAFAQEYESESEVSIACSADVLRVIGDEGVPLKDLPHLSGVSKPAIAMTVSFLTKRGYAFAAVAPGPRAKTKVIQLTTKGRRVRDQYPELVASIQSRWRNRFGQQLVNELEESLRGIVGDGSAQSRLFAGLEPYPDNWRSLGNLPAALPHYPMVLHRGGFPDGS